MNRIDLVIAGIERVCGLAHLSLRPRIKSVARRLMRDGLLPPLLEENRAKNSVVSMAR
jgi:hypothetical protein